MITVQIGDEERDIADAPPSWIKEQIARRRSNSDPVCVQIHIQKGQLDTRLITPDCPSGKGRAPSPLEREIFDLWTKHRLNQSDFTGENLLHFLREVS